MTRNSGWRLVMALRPRIALLGITVHAIILSRQIQRCRIEERTTCVSSVFAEYEEGFLASLEMTGYG